ncbi:hypothetical protein D3C72_1962840 [compost metagenome]
MQILRLGLEPIAMVLQVMPPSEFPIALFKERQPFERGDQRRNMQTRAAGLGQRCGMIHGGGMAQDRVDDQ